MGRGRWDETTYRSYASSVKSKSRQEVFKSTRMLDDLNPKLIQMRESRDSEQNPESTPIIIGLDVTGSMGYLAEKMAKEHLGTLVDYILDRLPVTDPHIMFMGIGDAVAGDSAPLQVTQFEADTTIIPQLEGIWLESRGGGNNYESYELPWAFAAHKTASDAWDKRQKKGYIFTIGDEEFPGSTDQIFFKKAISEGLPQTATPEDIYDAASERYHVFHLVVKEGSYARSRSKDVLNRWRDKIGKRALMLTDSDRVAEVIVSAIAVSEGKTPEEEIESWKGGARDAVRAALEVHDN